jgi:hypothetical protein
MQATTISETRQDSVKMALRMLMLFIRIGCCVTSPGFKILAANRGNTKFVAM